MSHAIDIPLTILTDSYNLLLLIESSMNPGSGRLLEDHPHKHILLPFMTALFERTATTTWVKVKSHCGALLNEAADFYADKGKALPFHGPLPDIDAAEITYWHATDDHGDDIITPLTSASQRDRIWKEELHQLAQARHLAADKITTSFIYAPVLDASTCNTP